MKKFALILLVFVVLLFAYKAYYFNKTTSTKESQINTVQPISQTSEINKSYNIIKSNWPKGDILGNILSIDENTVTIKELVSLECFYGFDYVLDENNKLSETEINAQYNTEYLPWCEDPSGGTLYKETGKDLTFIFDDKTLFSITVFDQDSLMGNVTKKIFIQKIEEYKPYPMMATLTLNGTIVTRIDEVYND